MWQAPDADDGDWEVINVPHNITSEADDDGKFGAVGIAEADGFAGIILFEPFDDAVNSLRRVCRGNFDTGIIFL